MLREVSWLRQHNYGVEGQVAADWSSKRRDWVGCLRAENYKNANTAKISSPRPTAPRV
jgi:hypothetical protein